jgi:uncharacterized protein (DUF488 family)
MPAIFTIGHSNHPIERFLELLSQNQIEELVDIRRFPGSRKHPHFNRENLDALLARHGIVYRWVEALGGRRRPIPGVPSENLAWKNAGFRNYADYMGTASFREAAQTLIDAAIERRTAIMCAEGLWWQCHRRLVSDYLTISGITVEHILPNGQLKPHVLTPSAVVTDGRIAYPASNTLF